jgi:hypothetical protein
MSGISGTQSELLYSMPAAVTKNTYTAQAAFTGVLGTNTVCKLPGGWLLNENPNPVGRALLLKVRGTAGNTAAATLAVALGFDPTAGTIANSITAMAATAPPVAAGAPFLFEAEYVCTAFATSTATFQVNGFLIMEAVASGAAGSASSLRAGFSGTHAGFDPRVDNYIELFGTWSASAAANTTTVQQMKLYGEN